MNKTRKCIATKPSKKTLIKLYTKERLTHKQIGIKFGVSRQTVGRWFKIYKIKTNNNRDKYAVQRGIPFTEQQKEFLIGNMLGDGFLECKKFSAPRMNINHSVAQAEYFFYKKDLFDTYIYTLYLNKERLRNSTKFSCTSINHEDFKFFYNYFYIKDENGKNIKIVREDIEKYLTPYAMAIWIMDDGWRSAKVNIRISTESFTKEEHEILVKAIKSKFNINCKWLKYTRNNKTYYYLAFNKENSILLTKLIDKYILPSMKYKLVYE